MSQSPIDSGPMRGRYVAPIPEEKAYQWQRRSAYLLCRWEQTRARVLEACGLDRPLDPAEARTWLQGRRETFPISGRLHIPLPSAPMKGLTAGGVYVSAADDGLRELMDAAQRMAVELGSPLRDNVGFLLLGLTFELPRLVVTYRPSPIGLVLEIRVGEGSVGEKEIKAAYMEARRQAIGTHSSKPPQSDAFVMALKDLEWREAGLSGPDRAKAWDEWRQQHDFGLTPLDYNGYRKQVAKTLAHVPWLAEYATTLSDSGEEVNEQ